MEEIKLDVTFQSSLPNIVSVQVHTKHSDWGNFWEAETVLAFLAVFRQCFKFSQYLIAIFIYFNPFYLDQNAINPPKS